VAGDPALRAVADRIRVVPDAELTAAYPEQWGATVVARTGTGELRAVVWRRSDWAAITRAGWVPDVAVAGALDPAALAGLLAGIGPRATVGVTHLELMPVNLRDAVEAALPNRTLGSATRCVDLVRLAKSEWEQERFTYAAQVAAAGWREMTDKLVPGVAEFELVASLERRIKAEGAEDNFMLIAFGGVDVRAMHAPEDRRLGDTDMVRTELTPQVDGYYAQICRTGVPLRPSAEQQRVYEIFYAAMEAGIDVVRAGVTAHDIAKAENDVLRKHGLGEYCTPQHTRVRGHALGLHPDESPGIQEGDETVIPEGATIVVHPNTYSPSAGYLVIGDPVIVTADGARRIVTADPELPRGTGASA
jgi:Xaa-Pro aminopeptidase